VQFYVSEVKVKNEGAEKIVDVKYIIKNLGSDAHAFDRAPYSTVKMKDTDGREYSRIKTGILDYVSSASVPDIIIPRNDIVHGSESFRIPQSSNPGKFYYSLFTSYPNYNNINIIVDLTNTKTPADPVPKSDWILTSNKGFKGQNGPISLTINDERFSSNNRDFIVDITIKNIGDKGILVSPSSLHLQDNQGYFYNQNQASPDFTLHDSNLVPSDMIRGNVVFKVDPNPGGDFMMIWSSGDGYINTGKIQS
jgi:hypothetical protein